MTNIEWRQLSREAKNKGDYHCLIHEILKYTQYNMVRAENFKNINTKAAVDWWYHF